ncbi:nucleotide exchange factor GrpE [Patescibacteria group bacterium]|nr:nucleotide exchange factor GrpE [Patescibacteria group bacterium]MBU1500925.1 nucleotide exchange factor GrpE [Patescibacteria group bacterium]MBU2080556.1 nucleotide exchange factor GrpE [Patescibacteria group bacterium]MBU2124368.1 nucleotide exchange factor GrpE [Patescibacteria group bacterium]MBU2194495.1 nucleotide exchange factor GrpE [Patescibacteria group bacterium]
MEDIDDVVLERDGSEEGMSEEEVDVIENKMDAKAAKLKKELELCKTERQEHLDGWQRAKADYVNALKRFDLEKEQAANLGVAKTIRALLPAYDALERAKGQGELPEGFAGIVKQLESGFESLQVTAIDTVGEVFNPAQHEALGTDPVTEASQDNTVTAILEKGYMLGETVLRPARVRVAQFEG